MTKTNEEVIDILKQNFHGCEEAPNTTPWWLRLKCRLFGPHEPIPLFEFVEHSNSLVEVGAVCQRCEKEFT